MNIILIINFLAFSYVVRTETLCKWSTKNGIQNFVIPKQIESAETFLIYCSVKPNNDDSYNFNISLAKDGQQFYFYNKFRK